MKLLRNILTAVLAIVFVVSSAMALGLTAEYQAGEESYAKAQSLATAGEQAVSGAETEPTTEALEISELADPAEPVLVSLAAESMLRIPCRESKQTATAIFDPHAAWLEELDLEALREVNPDVIGWISIPGTTISYPIVQGENNDYYLNHTWDGQRSATGAVFMEATHAADFSNFSTILYGHNLSMGNLFRPLHKYKDQAFWEENPYIYIVTDTGSFRYRIYAAYEAELTATTYWQYVDTQQRQQEYVQYGLDRSVLDTGTGPAAGAPVLTLSTCTDYTFARRWVVQAVLEGPVIPSPQ